MGRPTRATGMSPRTFSSLQGRNITENISCTVKNIVVSNRLVS